MCEIERRGKVKKKKRDHRAAERKIQIEGA